MISFTDSERVLLVSAVDEYVDVYEKMVADEDDERERALLRQRITSGTLVGGRVLANAELRSPELATLDRALRMLAHAKHLTIKPGRAENAEIRAEIGEVAALIKKLRQARGLPW